MKNEIITGTYQDRDTNKKIKVVAVGDNSVYVEMPEMISKASFIDRYEKVPVANTVEPRRDEQVFMNHAATGKFGSIDLDELEALLDD